VSTWRRSGQRRVGSFLAREIATLTTLAARPSVATCASATAVASVTSVDGDVLEDRRIHGLLDILV